MFLVNKQKKMEQQFQEYCTQVAGCLSIFRQAFIEYKDQKDNAELKKHVVQLHKFESRADDIRKDIEMLMYSKSLFPESRGDLLGLLETMDRMPNQAQTALRMLLNQQIKIPEDHTLKILHMVEISHRCVIAVLDSVQKLFINFTNAAVSVGSIDELESEVDSIETDLIQEIFKSQLNGFDKILLRDLVQNIEAVSDRAQNVADRIRIVVAKRSV